MPLEFLGCAWYSHSYYKTYILVMHTKPALDAVMQYFPSFSLADCNAKLWNAMAYCECVMQITVCRDRLVAT